MFAGGIAPTPELGDAVRAHVRAAQGRARPPGTPATTTTTSPRPRPGRTPCSRATPTGRLREIKASYDPDQAIVSAHPVRPAGTEMSALAARPEEPTPASVWRGDGGEPIGDELLEWPPDLFALTDVILERSEAYRFALSPPGGARVAAGPHPGWPDAVVGRGPAVERLGRGPEREQSRSAAPRSGRCSAKATETAARAAHRGA